MRKNNGKNGKRNVEMEEMVKSIGVVTLYDELKKVERSVKRKGEALREEMVKRNYNEEAVSKASLKKIRECFSNEMSKIMKREEPAMLDGMRMKNISVLVELLQEVEDSQDYLELLEKEIVRRGLNILNNYNEEDLNINKLNETLELLNERINDIMKPGPAREIVIEMKKDLEELRELIKKLYSDIQIKIYKRSGILDMAKYYWNWKISSLIVEYVFSKEIGAIGEEERLRLEKILNKIIELDKSLTEEERGEDSLSLKELNEAKMKLLLERRELVKNIGFISMKEYMVKLNKLNEAIEEIDSKKVEIEES